MKSRKRRQARRPRRHTLRLWLHAAGRYLLVVAGVLAASAVATVALYGIVPPPATPLMLIRGYEDGVWEAHWDWVEYEEISPHLVRAAIASEDARFCEHIGFDWRQLRIAYRTWRREGYLRGASTISNQTAKNLFLWPERSFLRKGIEAGFTVLIELLWSKRRIMETYLNVAEFGPGVYGAEAAARSFFGVPARRLSVRQAALLAAALPDPWTRSPKRPGNDLLAIARRIESRMRKTPLGPNGPCS